MGRERESPSCLCSSPYSSGVFSGMVGIIGIKQEQNSTMPRVKNAARSSKPDDKPKTIQRTYRFDTKLFEAFEDDCATHLANPKRVIEALILHWLDADTDERAAMAHKHRERIGSASRDEE
jgi:hypothetical protein